MIKCKQRKAGEELCLRHLTISRFIHNRRHIISDIMHVNVVLFLLNIWNMLIRRLCLHSVMLWKCHTLYDVISPDRMWAAPHTKKGVSFSPVRLKPLERFEERWGCHSFLKSNSISLTAKLIESYHPAGDTARPKGRKSRLVLFAW